RQTLPVLTNLRMGWAALIQTLAQGGGTQGSTIMTTWAANLASMKVAADGLAESMGKIGKKQLEPPPDDAPKIAKTREAWLGLSDILERVRERAQDLSSVDQKTTKELEQTQFGIDKVVAKYRELSAAGKLSKEDAASQAAALAPM